MTRRIAAARAQLQAAAPGAALGARACEAQARPLNPAGIQRYNSGMLPMRLDDLARDLRTYRATFNDTVVYHSFVIAALPPRGGWPQAPSPAQGLTIAVIVDRETPADREIAIKIGGELAAAVERWATLVGRPELPEARQSQAAVH